MCGIFGLINKPIDFDSKFIQTQFEKGKGRGPEDSKLISFGQDVDFGFHRLAINGLNDISNQPIIINNIALICNGEIYNYKELYHEIGVTPKTDSDCEIIIHLYLLFGIERTLQLLDGVFSFALYDMNIVDLEPIKIFLARDPLGVRPLYILRSNNNSNSNRNSNFHNYILFGSEMKMLSEFYNEEYYSLVQFTPGTYSVFEKSYTILSRWKEVTINKPYFLLNHSYTLLNREHSNKNKNTGLFENSKNELEWIISGIQNHLCNAIKKRYLNTERPIACLLSGGLDSSLITALVVNIHKTYSNKPIETYSIGLQNSEDLIYAKMVSEYLGTNHTEIIVSEKEMIDAIPEVIYAIESYDTTTVRASIGNYLLGKYISKNSKAKVIFNGDGSDELCGGYLYMNNAPNSLEFENETRRLLKDIHLYDVLRSDKSISSHGLEPRTPFLDKNFVNFYMSIPSVLKRHTNLNKCEKFLLRYSFSFVNYNIQNKQILPDEILWRKKEAFSDGVSNTGRSLYTIIQEYTNTLNINIDSSPYIEKIIKHNIPKTNEQMYYRKLFDEYYPCLEKIVPYFWMPKYVNATDPSARTLSIYNEKHPLPSVL
jgi:asparagine synthase (glutamine-hydrolysing)